MSLNKLGRYDLIRVLGKGAMGLVYEARDPNLDRRVAIKTIKVENLSEEAAAEYEARFRTEARSAARLQHPNIVSVYDSDRHGDVAFLVMEFIEGEDLKHHLDSGKRYSLEQSLRMVGDLLSALEYAHRQSVVHRDVKPANLLIENDGRVKLTDFGVARIQDSSEATRTQGSMVGTLKYMSPEQVQGQPIDARADLFAVGIVLYQLLTGQRPFDGDTDFAIIQKIVGHTPDMPSLFNPLLPPAIDAVVLRALAKKREQRFTTAQDFARALQEASGQASDPTIVPPVSQPGGNATDAGRQRSHVGGSTVKLSSSGTDTGSTVTQELELVYWKDIKDSDDLEDLEGFLGRFPSGIYADLARRRVKRLTGTASDEGSGEGSGTAMQAVAPAADAEWARLQAQNVLKPAALASARVTASTAEANDPDATRMAGAGLPLANPRSPAAVAEPSPAAPGEAPAAPAASRSKMPLFALAGVAVLVAAGVIFKRLPGTAAPVQVALPAVASEAPVASPAPPAVAPPAALPRTPKPLPKPKPARPAAAETVAEPAAALATASNPGQACENRILLGFQRCMNEQCAKPAFSKHPVCVERRAMEKLRRESQEMRN
ncbi:MAG: serine/threonine-protein kinase [Polaromonas sp.]|nr:serine/threonine-protein kinase [Polaromonas sp.]